VKNDELFKHYSTQFSILAQNINNSVPKTRRKVKLRWVLAISCLPLFGIHTAFGVSPQTLTSNVTQTFWHKGIEMAAPTGTRVKAEFDVISNQFSAQLRLLGPSNIAALE